MANDARSKYTQTMIRNSFIKLLNEKPLAQIKLKEVCELAGINRSTFYRYYQDTFDWAEKMEAECLKWAKSFTEKMNNDNFEEILLHMLTATSQNYELFQALFSSQNNTKFTEEVFNIFLKKASLKVNQWDSYFIVSGWNGTIKCWIENDLKQTPQEVAAYMIKQLKKFVIDTQDSEITKSIWKQ